MGYTNGCDLVFPTADPLDGGLSLRELFAVQILNGLVGKYGVPGREPYRMDLPEVEQHRRSADVTAESTTEYMRRADAYRERVTQFNRASICRIAVEMADTLIDALNATPWADAAAPTANEEASC